MGQTWMKEGGPWPGGVPREDVDQGSPVEHPAHAPRCFPRGWCSSEGGRQDPPTTTHEPRMHHRPRARGCRAETATNHRLAPRLVPWEGEQPTGSPWAPSSKGKPAASMNHLKRTREFLLSPGPQRHGRVLAAGHKYRMCFRSQPGDRSAQALSPRPASEDPVICPCRAGGCPPSI